MSTSVNPTRQRLVNAALDLFTQQGVAETTTKQIAELAEVNEVTLFRQFGNKQGLLLAVMEESEVFEQLANSVGQQFLRSVSTQEPYDDAPAQKIRHYAQTTLSRLDSVPELLRSLIGEAGKYPSQNREALGQGIHRMNQILAEYLSTVSSNVQGDRWVSLVNSTLLGYAILDVTTEFHRLWTTREAFVEDLVRWVLSQPDAASVVPEPLQQIMDLPASLVHTLLQRAQKQGTREWALIYLLFGAGVSPAEIARLERVHYLSDREVQVLQVTQGAVRQVPVNQWIMGKRYGTYLKNPLTQWLKGRKDSQPALLLGADDAPIAIAEIHEIWQQLAKDLLTLEGKTPTIEQAQQTWCVEMLSRGMSLENMQVLTGLSIEQLAPYGKRAKEKAVLEQGLLLDKHK